MRNKKVAILLFLSLILNAQEILWTRQFDSGYDDYGGPSALDPEGNIVLAGIIGYSFFASDLLVLKYTPDGNLIWHRIYDFQFGDGATGLAIDRSGNIIVSGIYQYQIGGRFAGFLLKLNPEGDTIWYRTYSHPRLALDMIDVVVDSNDNIITCGRIWSPDSLLLMKCDSDGNIIWRKTHKWAQHQFTNCLALDNSGNIIASGHIFRPPIPPLISDIFLVKFDSLGDTIWTRRYDFNFTDVPSEISFDNSGNILLTGETGNDTLTTDCLTMKITPDGNIIWRKTFDMDSVDYGIGIRANASEEIFVFGSSMNDYYFSEYADFMLIKYNPAGETVWVRRYDFARWDYGGSLQLSDNNELYAAGYIFEDSGDIFLMKLQDRLGMEEGITFDVKPRALKIYPNPFQKYLTIEYSLHSYSLVEIGIFDITGKEIRKIKEYQKEGIHKYLWDGRDKDGKILPCGVYFITAKAGKDFVREKVIKTE